jgi:hypothetical protein
VNRHNSLWNEVNVVIEDIRPVKTETCDTGLVAAHGTRIKVAKKV